MLLLAHTLTGAVIGAKVSSPWLSFALGFTSHFLLDAIPHWNYPVPQRIHIRDFIVFWPDLTAPALLVLAFIALHPSALLAICFGVTGSILPDILTLTRHHVSLKRIFAPFRKFHEKIQHEIPFTPGVLVQIAYMLVLLALLRL